MRHTPLVTTALLCIALVFLSACSSAGPHAQAGAPRDLQSLPDLTVQVLCADCQVPPETLDNIRKAYQQEALKRQLPINPGLPPAVLGLTVYQTRPLALRLAGPLSAVMTDRLAGELRFGNETLQVEETARAPFRGIESVSAALGQSIATRLSEPRVSAAPAP